MQIQVKIVEVGKEQWTKTSKGGYGKIAVKFIGDKGEQSRNFVSYDASIYQEVKKLEVGATYDVRIEKEGDFWNWKEIKKISDADAAQTLTTPSKGGTSSGSNWDERLKFDREKQILIVRQSQVTNAITALGSGRSAEDYCEFADKLVHYVNTGEYPLIEVNEPSQEDNSPKRGRPRKEVADIE